MDKYADISGLIEDGSFITDGHGNLWLNACEDCGGVLGIVRPGKAQCSKGCENDGIYNG